MAESGRGKSYSDAQNERFRAAARTLVEREGSATAAAKLLGVGDELVNGHARIGDPARPVLRNRPGYNEALVLALPHAALRSARLAGELEPAALLERQRYAPRWALVARVEQAIESLGIEAA